MLRLLVYTLLYEQCIFIVDFDLIENVLNRETLFVFQLELPELFRFRFFGRELPIVGQLGCLQRRQQVARRELLILALSALALLGDRR